MPLLHEQFSDDNGDTGASQDRLTKSLSRRVEDVGDRAVVVSERVSDVHSVVEGEDVEAVADCERGTLDEVSIAAKRLTEAAETLIRAAFALERAARLAQQEDTDE